MAPHSKRMAVHDSRKLSVLLVFSFLSASVSLSSACPDACECKWKGGKQTVECRNRGLITLPSNIDHATQVLDLSGSNLQILPREAFMKAELLNLQKIYLANCRIGQIDASALRGLTNLVELDLSDNMLTQVPSEAFRDATSIRELRLNSNPIQKIEDGAFELLPGLVKLDLTDCQIQSVANRSFQGLDQLSHLRLSGNRLTELTMPVISTLTRLHAIELHRNAWICDCRLRHAREWIQLHNIPMPVAPTCATPARLAGRSLFDLHLDEFACPPQVVTWSNFPRQVESTAGTNATIICRMTAVPSPEISWLWKGRPVTNSSTTCCLDGGGGGGAGDAKDDVGRKIIIVEHGTFDRTSQLMLLPARESDSGEFVCVAANPAGLAKVNVTLRVNAQPSAAGVLAGAQVAGLAVGLLILVVLLIGVLILLVSRCRMQTGRGKNREAKQIVHQTVSSHAGFVGGDHKSPSTSALEYGQVTLQVSHPVAQPAPPQSSSSSSSSSAANNKPDLIHEARKAAEYWHHNLKETMLDYPPVGDDPTCEIDCKLNKRYDCENGDIVTQMQASGGEYQSAQTDSLYPSALWNQIIAGVNDTTDISNDPRLATHMTPDNYSNAPTLNMPHVPHKSGHHHHCTSNNNNNNNMRAVELQPSYLESEGESISIDSYTFPAANRAVPQHQEHIYGSVDRVPYPPDYGLPRTASPMMNHIIVLQNGLPSPTATLSRCQAASSASAAAADHSKNSTIYGSCVKINPTANWNGSVPASIESSPANSIKSPRFWHRPAIASSKRSFARDSPDEGYQEECATDV